MVEISLCAMRILPGGGPDIPADFSVWIGDRPYPGGTVKELLISVGDCTIRIWPADPEKIANFATKLAKIATELKEVENVY